MSAQGSGRRPVAAFAVAGVLFVAVAGGVGFTAVTVHDADRAPGKPTWSFPSAPTEKAGGGGGGSGPASGSGKAVSELGRMLLPVGTDGYSRGPDMGGFGWDADLTGAQAAALRKESLRTLPAAERRKLERAIDKTPIKGMAMRSYSSTDEAADSTVYADGAFTVEIVLSRMANTRDAHEVARYEAEFLAAIEAALKDDRKGPQIKGYPNAKCVLAPDDADEKLDSMVCAAAKGDVVVTATAQGPKPVDAKAVALLLREQLDRIETSGESV